MSDPINLQPTANTNLEPKVENQDELSKVPQSGYSQEDSSSEVQAKTIQKLSLNIEDIKQTNNQTANSYINTALIERLNAFNDSLLISNFNTINQYQNNILDVVQDSALLIMTLQNFLHGFKMMNTMINVVADNNSKVVLNNNKNQLHEIDKTIRNAENEIIALQQQNQSNKQQFSSFNSELNTEVNKLNEYNANLNQNNNSNTTSEQDILTIKNKINLLTEKSNQVKKLIADTEQEITQAITTKEQQVLLSNKLVNFIDNIEKTMINIPVLVKKVIINSGYNYQAVMKLIISISDKSKENIEEEKENANKDRINEKITVEKEQQDDYQEDLLQVRFLSRVLSAFSVNRAPAIAGTEKNMPLAENLQAPVALVLIADINDKKFPDLSHKQPHLGDSLSLDGADNPLAYGMILLAYQMQHLKNNMAISNNMIKKGQKKDNIPINNNIIDENQQKQKDDIPISNNMINEVQQKDNIPINNNIINEDQQKDNIPINNNMTNEVQQKDNIPINNNMTNEVQQKQKDDVPISNNMINEVQQKQKDDVPISNNMINEVQQKQKDDVPISNNMINEVQQKQKDDVPISNNMINEVRQKDNIPINNNITNEIQQKDNMPINNNMANEAQQELTFMKELFDLQNEVDSLVFNSLKQAELSQAEQRRSV